MSGDGAKDDLLTQNLNASMAIWLSARIEDELRDFIISRMVRSNRDSRKRLFEGYGPLSSFSAKIEIAYAFGMLTDIERSYMLAIKAIRNKFAHSSGGLTFDSPAFDELFAKLPGSFTQTVRREIYIEIAVRCLASMDGQKVRSIADLYS